MIPSLPDLSAPGLGRHTLEAGERVFEFERKSPGALTFRVRERSDPESQSEQVWALSGRNGQLTSQTTGPDRPLLVALSSELFVAPRDSVSLCVTVPLFLRIVTAEQDGAMFDGPCRRISKTWIGNTMEGEIGWHWKSDPFVDPASDPSASDLALCPVQIRNAGTEPLLVPAFCLRTMHTSLYRVKEQCVFSEICILYRGKGRMSEVKYARKPPLSATASDLICTARENPPARIVAWTLQNLVGQPGY